MNHPNSVYMQHAIALACRNFEAGNHAVGAVVVLHNEIIAEGAATIRADRDPTCHAEINAIRSAAKRLDTYKLENCYLYSTYEPCPMCCSAVIWARMSGIVYGSSHLDASDKLPWRISIPAETIVNHGMPKVILYPEFMREESSKLSQL